MASSPDVHLKVDVCREFLPSASLALSLKGTDEGIRAEARHIRIRPVTGLLVFLRFPR